MLILIIALILLLYTRIWDYKHIIDDPVPREKAPWHPPMKMPPSYYEKKRPIMYSITTIGTYIGVCLGVYVNFGWEAALLYAVFPLNVSQAIWQVGGFYGAGVLFVLTGMYFLPFGPWGGVLSACMYYWALQSSFSTLPYIVLVILKISGL